MIIVRGRGQEWVEGTSNIIVNEAYLSRKHPCKPMSGHYNQPATHACMVTSQAVKDALLVLLVAGPRANLMSVQLT